MIAMIRANAHYSGQIHAKLREKFRNSEGYIGTGRPREDILLFILEDRDREAFEAAHRAIPPDRRGRLSFLQDVTYPNVAAASS